MLKKFRERSIWQDAKNAIEADSLHKRPDHSYLKAIYKANDKGSPPVPSASRKITKPHYFICIYEKEIVNL